MTELGQQVATDSGIGRAFRALSGTPLPWLIAATLVCLLIVMGFLAVMVPLQAAIRDNAGYRLIDLELADNIAPRLLRPMRTLLGAKGETAETVLNRLKGVPMEEHVGDGRTALQRMKTLQWLAVGFTLFYGTLLVLLAALLWRVHPAFPTAGRWLWLVGLGAPAALLDEAENFCILRMIGLTIRGGSVVAPWPALATVFSVPKWGLLFVAMLALWAFPLSLLAKLALSIMRRAG